MLKRLAVVCAATLIAACASRHERAAAPAAAPGAPVRLVVLGDSLALGTGAAEPTGGFAFRIYAQIARERPGSEITSFAIGGTTVADVLRLEAGRLRDTHANVILLCVGGNDVVRRTDPASFARLYTELVAEIKRNAPHAKLVLFGVPNVAVSPLFADFDASAIGALSRADDAVVRSAAARFGAAFVDLYALSDSIRRRPGFFSSDRFHPSDDGHERIARRALPAIERILRS